MLPARRALLVAALIVFVWTGTAFAECAWVLWTAPSTMDPNVPWVKAAHRYRQAEFEPIEAYKTAANCEQAQTEKMNREFQAVKERNGPGAKMWNTYIFRCLPDTIDPRGSKTN